MDEGDIQVVAGVLLLAIIAGFAFTFCLEPFWWR